MNEGDRGRKPPGDLGATRPEAPQEAHVPGRLGNPLQRMKAERSAAAAQISRSLKRWSASDDASTKSEAADVSSTDHEGVGAATHVAAKLESSETIFRAVDPKLLALAKKYDLNASSPTSLQILNGLQMTCKEFIAAYRKPGIVSVFPGEYLLMTVQAALDAGKSTVRKLLTDGRFVK